MSFFSIWKNYFWLSAGVVWFAVVLFLSLTTSQKIIGLVGSFHFGEQAAHAFSYGLLMFCFLKASSPYPSAWRIGAFCFGIGVFVEILQFLGGHRGFEIIDIVSNLAGIFIGYLAFLAIEKRQLLFS